MRGKLTALGPARQHSTAILESDEGQVQAACTCGWRSPIFGVDKRLGAMDARQHADDAADLHLWDASMR